jgi:hypothetical protein
LGIHEILGFSKSFVANFPCRRCKISKNCLHRSCKEIPALLRNEENYKADVAANDLSKTGISENCAFHQITSFKVWENTCFDIMHDFLEGVLHYDLSLIFQHYISEKIFTLEDLNNRIKSFDYGPLDQGSKIENL